MNGTRKPLLLTALIALALIAVGLFAQQYLPLRSVSSCATSPVTMFDITWACGFPILEGLAKVVLLLAVVRFFVNPVTASLIGFANNSKLLKEQQLADDSNDSVAWVNAFAVLAIGWVVFMTPYTVLPNYAANLLVRLPQFYLWALLFTAVFSRFQLGMKSITTYVENFRAGHTEAAAIWTIVSMLLAAWLVVGVR